MIDLLESAKSWSFVWLRRDPKAPPYTLAGIMGAAAATALLLTGPVPATALKFDEMSK